jgi:threonine/homoserine/homoserine lactone efflux protein
MDLPLALAAGLAGFIYVITPGPAFLALFALGAARGRPAALRFMAGHLAGDIVWGALAIAAIIGVSALGPLLFDLLGIACGVYLVWLGVKAIRARDVSGKAVAGAANPLRTGVLFGLTNPKAYPVSLAMFGALVAPFGDRIGPASLPSLGLGALAGFVLADAVLLFWIGLPAVRRFFARHGLWVTRAVGVTFLLFGAKSIADGGRGVLAARQGS